MTTKIIMTESTKNAINSKLHVDVDQLSDEAIIDMLRNDANFVICFKEGGKISVKRVLKG